MKKRRLFYVPGLISLLGLPVLLLIWGPEDPVQDCVMRLNLPSEARDQPGILRFNRAGVLRMLKRKKVISLWFDDRPSHLHPETNPYRRSVFLLNEISRQQFTHDTSLVLKVSFDERNDYGDFVWMMDNAKLFDYKRYAYLDNELYLFANPPPRPPDTSLHDIPLAFGPDVVIDKAWTRPGSWEVFGREVGEKWQEFAYAARHSATLCTGFLLLIALPGTVYAIKKTRRQAGL